MSKTRHLIAEMEARETRTDKDYEQLLETWDIPADENITAHEANMWLHAQLIQQEQLTQTYVLDGFSGYPPEEWDATVEFVWKCLRHGVVPYEYINLLVNRQQDWDAWCDAL